LAAEKAIEISLSFALGHLVLGMGHLFRGGAAEAIPPLGHGLALNSYDPQNFVWLNLLALAYLLTDQADKALSVATRARNIRPSWRPIHGTLVCCHVSLGRWPEAQASLQEMRQMEKPPGDALQPLRSCSPHFAQR